jgi:hypothetical protein
MEGPSLQVPLRNSNPTWYPERAVTTPSIDEIEHFLQNLQIEPKEKQFFTQLTLEEYLSRFDSIADRCDLHELHFQNFAVSVRLSRLRARAR